MQPHSTGREKGGKTMSAAHRGVPIWGVSLLFLVLNTPARGQISPNLVSYTSRSATKYRVVFPPPPADLAFSLQPVSKHYDVIQVRSKLGKAFWFGWGLAASLSVASAEMTIRCERLANCSEVNPLFGKKPGRLELYAPRAGVITAGILLCRHWKRSDPNDRAPTITVVGVDAIWGADAGWDAYELSTIPKSASARLIVHP